MSFIRENMWRLEDNELDDWMLAGFEITFPQLLEMANSLGLDVPLDEPALQAIYAKRYIKLARCLFVSPLGDIWLICYPSLSPKK
jgi:hypothetical protein